MQCHLPLFGIGYPSPGQYFQSNPVNPSSDLAPDVIGEGEVTAITFPDGTIQYYFLPVRWHNDVYTKRWPSYLFTDGYNCNEPHKCVWVIRNFSTTISPIFNQFWQKNIEPFSKPCFNYDCKGSNNPGYQLKFHNDCSTSTTDLHCFCPLWRPLPTTCSASVQVEKISKEPKCSCHTADFNIPCISAKRTCDDKKEYNNNSDQCKCKKRETIRSSRMSIDKSRTSSDSCSLKKVKSRNEKRKKSYTSSSCSSYYDNRRATRKRKKVICECDLQRFSNAKIKNNGQKQPTWRNTGLICEDVRLNTYSEPNVGSQRSAKKSSEVHCECNEQSIADKAVVTYNDQASSVNEVEGQTQTEENINRSCSKLNLKQQLSDSSLCVTKRLFNRNCKSAKYPKKITGMCEISSSGSSSSSSYCRCSTSQESVQ